jgi:hypothetical protein
MTIRDRYARPARIALLLLASWPITALAQPSAEKPPEPPKPKELALSPAAAPVPSLKYRLLPSAAELNPGDAAPIYLRIHGYEDSSLDEAWRQISEKSGKWRDLPLDQLPVAEARAFVNLWSGKLRQLEYGTRRKTCDWSYTLPEERSRAVEILLPDAQSMRQWGRILALKARVEIAEKKYDEAVRTIVTGLAFSRHLATGPFLINGLIGIVVANMMLDQADLLIAQPGAPNLYWALTALPRPLIDMREQSEIEQKMLEYVIPELSEAELERPREAAEWGPYLARMYVGILRWSEEFAQGDRDYPWLREKSGWDLARLRAEFLPPARDYLKATRGLDARQLAAMPDDQLVALYVAGRYRELNDEAFRSAYLEPRDAIPYLAAVEKRLQPFAAGPLALPVMNLKAIHAMQTTIVWPDRSIAKLRLLEAIRLYAAAHDGKLPDSLEQITEVPVPEDPATGKPFLYRRSGDAAILHVPQAGLRNPWPTYRITIRR